MNPQNSQGSSSKDKDSEDSPVEQVKDDDMPTFPYPPFVTFDPPPVITTVIIYPFPNDQPYSYTIGT